MMKVCLYINLSGRSVCSFTTKSQFCDISKESINHLTSGSFDVTPFISNSGYLNGEVIIHKDFQVP